MKGRKAPAVERLFEHIAIGDDGCWRWVGAIDRYGYGRIQVAGGSRLAHRIAYAELVDPIPEGLQLDHLCRVRHCINPDHLEPVTGRTNVLRGDTPAARNAAKTHCVRGHELADDNLFVGTDGYRRCRTCMRARDREAKRARRAARNAEVAA